MPRISVILPTYNGEEYLQDALQSIFAQTYSDFEVIAINDGSTDQTPEILDSVKDKRLKVIYQKNHGLALSLNIGIRAATGEFIARQDQDDISLPTRFEKQVEYFDNHPKCGLLGTHANIWKNNQKTKRKIQHPYDNATLQLLGLFNCRFVHSSVMARTEVMINAGMYPSDPLRNPPEDFDLWLRMMKQCDVANLPLPLLYYREVATGITQTNKLLIQERTHQIACDNLLSLLNHQQSYHDFVALMRFNIKQLSRHPDWDHCYETIERLQQYLLSRFLDEHQMIHDGVKILKHRLQALKTGHRVLGKHLLHEMIGVARKIKKII